MLSFPLQHNQRSVSVVDLPRGAKDGAEEEIRRRDPTTNSPSPAPTRDDAARDDEKELVAQWQAEYSGVEHTYLEFERGCSVLEVKKS